MAPASDGFTVWMAIDPLWHVCFIERGYPVETAFMRIDAGYEARGMQQMTRDKDLRLEPIPSTFESFFAGRECRGSL